jgi:hypothetical protein
MSSEITFRKPNSGAVDSSGSDSISQDNSIAPSMGNRELSVTRLTANGTAVDLFAFPSKQVYDGLLIFTNFTSISIIRVNYDIPVSTTATTDISIHIPYYI